MLNQHSTRLLDVNKLDILNNKKKHTHTYIQHTHTLCSMSTLFKYVNIEKMNKRMAFGKMLAIR